MVGALLAMAFSLSACGGGSHSSLPATGPSSGGGAYAGAAPATFTFTFPKSTSGTKRSPKYLSSATASVSMQVTDVKNHGTSADIYANVPASLKAIQTANFTSLTQSPTTAGQCGAQPGNAANVQCTVVWLVPIGDDTMTVKSTDTAGGGGNILSQQIATPWVQQGVNNAIALSLDANAATMAINTSSGQCAGSFALVNGQTVGAVGTNAVTFTASYTDAQSKTIVGPGLPLLKINGSSTSGTITGTGGNVNYVINQATQSYTLAATSSNTNAAISVTATPGSATDGLTFNQTLNYTFQSGGAEPPGFLANAEEIISSGGVPTGGVIHLWTIGANDTFTAYTTPSLASQNNDVDFPNDLLFDNNGDLLIANGGAGSPDFGNFACVPAGAISTGANAATVLTNNLDDPTNIALGTDGSVDLVNGAFTTYDDVEFLLSGTYSAAPATRDVARIGNYAGVGVAALSTTGTNPAGSYAIGLYQGSPTKSSLLEIIHPDGTTVPISDVDIAEPRIAFDTSSSSTKQLVVVNDGRSLPSGDYTKSNFMVYNVSPVSKVNEFSITDDANGPTVPLGPVAVSPDGHIAIIVGDGNGFPELNVYDNTSAHAKIAGSLSYGAVLDCANLANFVYGGTISANVANKLVWLSNTKLLVQLYSQNSHVATPANGMYIYDVTQTQSQTGCDSASGVPLATTTVKQTGFQHLSNAPLAAAYKP